VATGQAGRWEEGEGVRCYTPAPVVLVGLVMRTQFVWWFDGEVLRLGAVRWM
jgi:hypothetical protein